MLETCPKRTEEAFILLTVSRAKGKKRGPSWLKARKSPRKKPKAQKKKNSEDVV